MSVIIYDTSLRDGTQGEGVQMSVADKLVVAGMLADLGVGYIEGGWPGSNPRDEQFFIEARALKLGKTKLTAFGATRRAGVPCENDASIQSLLRAETPAVAIFGKSWKFQATAALRISPEANLELIEDTVRYLKAHVNEVLFDAEHFFDGYADDPEYALAALAAAERGGADFLVLCDTNGGSLPGFVTQAVSDAVSKFKTAIGVHVHNDGELAVANSLAGVIAGATMVQGTVNGTGERCGNANLISIIPALALKMGIDCIPREKLKNLTRLSHTIDELTNRTPWSAQPYVGMSAFAHKGGMHVDAIKKDSRTYEHIEPEVVGNQRRILISDLSGKANIELKAQQFGLDLAGDPKQTRDILQRLKELENKGYQFEGAEASFKLVIDEATGKRPQFFKLRDLEVVIGLRGDEAVAEGEDTKVVDGSDAKQAAAETTAHIELEIGGVVANTSVVGEGPVHAMDLGLRQLIDKFYPSLKAVRLVDYKVRVMSSGDGTESVVRVLVQSTDGEETWGTVGVSPNIIQASWQALIDALDYKLMKDKVEPHVAAASSVVPNRPSRPSRATR